MAIADWQRYPLVARCTSARTWLSMQSNLGLADSTVDAYGRALQDYLTYCHAHDVSPDTARRPDVAGYVGDLLSRPHRLGRSVVHLGSGCGLANSTVQQRLTAVRLYYDYLVEEGVRDMNPVGRGRYTPRRGFGDAHRKGLVPRGARLPWIPTDDQWHAILAVVREESDRNRLMFALAYDAGLRREELCALHTDVLDPAHRLIRIRAETTKGRRERVVPYSATTASLLKSYLAHRRSMSSARGPLWLSESPRNRARPISLWTWSKVVRRVALQAGVAQFSTHTLRHLCLTDLARSNWELHAIATFAGHRNLDTTLQYVHLSGRDLANRLARSMSQLHASRIQALGDGEPTREARQ